MFFAGKIAIDVAIASAALLGFRHGFDYDHVAAISDIASSEREPRRAMRMGLTYACGHAATVALLGLGVIVFQHSLPSGTDTVMERITGASLLVLGIYVLWTAIFRPRAHTHAPRTRITVLANAALWLVWRIQLLFAPASKRRTLFADGIGAAPAFTVGIVHGLGAETPTQLMLFLLAANLGGFAKGLLGLGVFIAGMLVMNTLMCAAAAGVFQASVKRPAIAQWCAGLSAAYSILVGLVFLAGTSSVAAMVAR